jgi:hypothetical protein
MSRDLGTEMMPRPIWIVLISLLLSPLTSSAATQDVSRQEMRSLDEQVQEMKSDVLSIAAELSQLEERLLYPSGTQLALFIAFTGGDAFRLDAVQIEINGQLAAHHIYSYKELEALQSGGVQRIFTGNVPAGQHQLAVSVIGKQGGKDFTRSESFTFSKDIDPKLLGITLAGVDHGQGTIRLEDW